MEGANSRNQEKGGHFAGMSPQNFEKGLILHVFITNFLFLMFELLCINVFEL